MDRMVIDLDFLRDLLDDYNADETGAVIKCVLGKVYCSEYKIGQEDFPSRDLRTLSRILLNEYINYKRMESRR